MDHPTQILVDGLGAAGATSGILSQLQARIYALLLLREGPLSLDEIAAELQQSKSHVSVNIRALVEWHLVRLRPVAGSRKDHYEAATDFFRALQEIFERRFRWTVRQVLAAVREARAAAGDERAAGREARERGRLVEERLAGLEGFFALIDAGIGAFVRGEPFPAQKLRQVIPLPGPGSRPSRPTGSRARDR